MICKFRVAACPAGDRGKCGIVNPVPFKSARKTESFMRQDDVNPLADEKGLAQTHAQEHFTAQFPSAAARSLFEDQVDRHARDFERRALCPRQRRPHPDAG